MTLHTPKKKLYPDKTNISSFWQKKNALGVDQKSGLYP